MAFLLLVGLILVFVLAMLLSARRFEARERRAGKWDDKGPIVETTGPEERFRNVGMEERLEVIGDWNAPVIHDRSDEARPETPPSDESHGKHS